MTHRVVLQRLAKQDLRAAYEWSAERAPEAQRRFLTAQELEEARRFENDE